MISILKKLRTGLVKSLEVVLITLFALLVLDVLWGVISRGSGRLVAWMAEQGYQAWAFLPRGQSAWTGEVAINLLIWISLLGASVAYGAKAHLGVDYFVLKLHKDAQRLMDITVNVIVGMFAAAVLIWGGYILVARTLEQGQVTSALNIKVGYVYMAVPISGLFILLFCVENIAQLLTGRSEETETKQIIEETQQNQAVTQPEAS